MWRLYSKIYFIRNSFWKFYEVRSKMGDFNSCGKWSSRVLPLMVWWSLAWFPYFYSGFPWPYCAFLCASQKVRTLQACNFQNRQSKLICSLLWLKPMMQKHMDDEHYKTGQDHVCKICTLAFPNPPALFQHMHRNHVRAEVIFVSVSLIYWILDRTLWFDEKINFRRALFFFVKLQSALQFLLWPFHWSLFICRY